MSKLKANCAWWAVQAIKVNKNTDLIYRKAIKVLEEYIDTQLNNLSECSA